MTFLEKRAVAMRAIEFAAKRFGVDVSDALSLRDKECVRKKRTPALDAAVEAIQQALGVRHAI